MQAHAAIAGRSAGPCGGGDESLGPAWLLEHWLIGLDGVCVPVLGCRGQGTTYHFCSTTTKCPDWPKLQKLSMLNC